MTWFQVLGTFTMFPLLVRDGLRIPYFALNSAFLAFSLIYIEAVHRQKKITLPERRPSSLTNLLKGNFDAFSVSGAKGKENLFILLKKLFVALSVTGA
jgi:hypothetical protein